ncbi:MAG: HAMP domain-containing protein [Caldilinea sp. CFX5]|nr:HAMP domain-containing protein [Caldilinea sp. CFX5]
MKALKTLRLRFALWTAGLLLSALVLFGLFVYVIMAYNLRLVIDETLQAVATQLIVEVEQGGRLPIEDIIEEPQYQRLREQGFSVLVQDVAGNATQGHGPYTSLLKPVENFTAALQPGRFSTMRDPQTNDTIRVYGAQIVSDQGIEGFVQIARNLNDVGDTLRLLFITLLISGPLLIVVAGISGYFLAAQALQPIDAITRTARAISAQDLSARLHLPATEDEVGRLATTFDSMLARLENAFRRERQFTADASHELRTPLAAMQTIISGTLTRRRTTEEYEQALGDLGHEVERLRTLTDGLLQLARSDIKEALAKAEEVDLAFLLKDVIDSLQPLAEEKGLTIIDRTPDEGLIVHGDSDSLIRLFVNLIDNAIKYTCEGSITIAAKTPTAGAIAVTISDTGVGIAPEHLPHIFNRFYRVEKARSTRGIGLGLAIAQAIAQAHGGAIIGASEVGKGTIFTVHLATSTAATT